MDYGALKVTELKDELKKRNIAIAKLTRKQEFIDRLVEDDNEQAIGKSGDEVMAEDSTTNVENQVAHAQPEEPMSNAPAAENVAAQAGADNDVDKPEENKRKRRSSSPVPSEASVSKKLKQAKDDPVNSKTETPPQADPDGAGEETSMDVDGPAGRVVEPAKHIPTVAIYIRDLVRPLNAAQLRSHITSLARAGTDIDPIETFHVDALKTHAFVSFTALDYAVNVRTSLHDTVFPPEPTRKPLWVDYIPEDQVAFFIETEQTSAGPRPSESRRWEVMYVPSSSTGDIAAELVDVTARSLPVPTGPPVHQRSPTPPSAPSGSLKAQPPASTGAQPAAILSSVPLAELESLFPSTTSTPPIFFSPVDPDTVQARLTALADLTSPDWDPRADHARFGSSTTGGGAGRGLDQLRRYTFQDGAEVVDGGAEFGGGKAFGRERGGGGAGGRGGGRGGGGPPRGGGGGDWYRGDDGYGPPRSAGYGVGPPGGGGGGPGPASAGFERDPGWDRGYGGPPPPRFERERDYADHGRGDPYGNGGGAGAGGRYSNYRGAPPQGNNRFAPAPSGGPPHLGPGGGGGRGGGGGGGYRDRGGYPPNDGEWRGERW